jgi:hypothetical protein
VAACPVDQRRLGRLETSYLIHQRRPAWASLRALLIQVDDGRDNVVALLVVVHIHLDFAETCPPSRRLAYFRVGLNPFQARHEVLISSSLSAVA